MTFDVKLVEEIQWAFVESKSPLIEEAKLNSVAPTTDLKK